MKTKTVQLADGAKITVRELSLEEIDDWLADRIAESEANNSPSAAERAAKSVGVDMLLFPDQVNLDDVARMVDIDQFAFRKLAPSDLQEIIPVAKEVNPVFFDLWARMYAPTPTPPPSAIPTS